MLKITRITAWLLIAAIVVLSLVPSGLRPASDLPHGLEHFAIFAATGLAFGFGYRPRYSAAIALIIFAGATEVAQLVVPGRHARVSDFIVDALAVCIGWATSSALMRMLEASGRVVGVHEASTSLPKVTRYDPG